MPVQSIVDGKLAEQVSTTETTSTNANNNMDKEAFLQLLVAQMKYQDPLEPTSNTEYIAQYAQFSQVEMMQNMAGTMDTSAAMALVGKTVTVEVENAAGNTSQITGVVDYVEKSGTKNLLYIEGVPYNYDNLVNVWSEDYLNAVEQELAKKNSQDDAGNTSVNIPKTVSSPEQKAGDDTKSAAESKAVQDSVQTDARAVAESGAAQVRTEDEEEEKAINDSEEVIETV